MADHVQTSFSDSTGNFVKLATKDLGNRVHTLLTQAGAIVDSAGGIVNPDDFAQTLTRNADGTVNTIAFTDGTNTWTMTFSYTSGQVTGISKWVKS